MEDFSQYLDKPDITPTDLGAKRQSEMEAAKAFMTNVGRGASLGLVKYPAAGLQMGLRALTGAPVGTFGENVADVAEFYRQQEQQNPTAALAGQVVGGLAAAPGAGGALPAMIGRTALAGGVSGFTEKESLEDALKGAAFGAGTAGLLGSGTKLVRETAIKRGENKAIREYIKEYNARPLSQKIQIKEVIEYAKNPQEGLRNITVKELRNPPTLDEMKNFYAQVERGNLRELGLNPGMPSLIREPIQAAGRAAVGNIMAPIGYGGLGALGGTLLNVDPVIAATLAGGAQLIGAKGAALTAAEKAFVTNLGERSIRGQLGQPGVIPETLARATTIGVVPSMVREPTPNEFEQYMDVTPQPEPVIDTRTRLQSLADQFRAKFGTQ